VIGVKDKTFVAVGMAEDDALPDATKRERTPAELLPGRSL